MVGHHEIMIDYRSLYFGSSLVVRSATDQKGIIIGRLITFDPSLTELLYLMERVASNEEKAETHAEHETSNKSDPPGFSLSYDGPTPHPIGDGAPTTVPHAAVPKKISNTYVLSMFPDICITQM